MLYINGINLLDLDDASEAARIASNNGFDDIALLFDKIAELQQENSDLQDALDEAESDSLTLWESRNGSVYWYVHFFASCFERLNGHYPCPSVSSDYDKNLIYEAIERGCENETN